MVKLDNMGCVIWGNKGKYGKMLGNMSTQIARKTDKQIDRHMIIFIRHIAAIYHENMLNIINGDIVQEYHQE